MLSTKNKYLLVLPLLALVGTSAYPVNAQEETPHAEKPKADVTDSDLKERLELAQKILELRPASRQVDKAIRQYAKYSLPESKHEEFVAKMKEILDYNALEKISIDAYADVFTKNELIAMTEYYSKPEARSASDKLDDYAAIVYPKIIKMLDNAQMRLRTGNNP